MLHFMFQMITISDVVSARKSKVKMACEAATKDLILSMATSKNDVDVIRQAEDKLKTQVDVVSAWNDSLEKRKFYRRLLEMIETLENARVDASIVHPPIIKKVARLYIKLKLKLRQLV